MNIKKIKEHYSEERQYQQRIDLATKDYNGKLYTYNFIKSVSLLAPYRRGERVVDIGCGFGYLVHFLPSYVEAYGVDFSPSALTIAKNFRNLIEVQTDAHNLPFKNESFDKLFCMNLTPHLLNLNKALKEFLRILKPNGLAVINFLNKYGLINIPYTIFNIKLGLYFNHNIMTPSPQNCFSTHEMIRIISKAGFKPLATYGWGISFPHFLGKKIPQVAYKTNDLMIKYQNFPLIKFLSNAITFKVRKTDG